ncbi:MAG: YdbL family protein [Gammaproteobacteria bacterium]
MKTLSKSAIFLTMMLLAACVTINVYFPAAAAEKAADLIIRDVYGETPESKPVPEQTPGPTSQRGGEQSFMEPVVGVLLNWMISPAYAGADISIETPAIQGIKASMKDRHRSLAPFYGSGVIGMTSAGLITVRDLNAVKLPDRRKVQQLVADENRDRNALYGEIARANGHPEWEKEIRGTFAKRWVANAPPGWWYQQGTTWKQIQ